MKLLFLVYSMLTFPFLILMKKLNGEFSTEILRDELYLSSFPVFKSELNELKDKGVTLCINMSYELYRGSYRDNFFKESGIKEVIFEVFDGIPVKTEYLEQIKNLIKEEIKNGGKVNVNCALGHSRSYSCVLYYLIKEEGFEFEEGEEYVKGLRKMVGLNRKQRKSFIKTLEANL